MNINLVQPFGYAEMFELANIEKYAYGRFVGFDYNEPEKITWTNDYDNLIGVTSANFSYLSNLYNEWPYKYLYDQYGDIYIKSDICAKGKIDYDDINEIPYLKTYKEERHIPVINKKYNDQFNYIPRNSRQEWIPVTILGRCIVEDDESCIPGKYCYLYNGDDQSLYGTVTLNKPIKEYKGWKVLKRISKNTIMIFIK